MQEGSREQTGCFLATLMVLAAAFTVRALFRAFWRMRGDAPSVPTETQTVVVIGLAGCIVVLAIFALKLKMWALVGYAVVSVFGIAFSAAYELGLVIPLLIGLCSVGAVSFARRDLFE